MRKEKKSLFSFFLGKKRFCQKKKKHNRLSLETTLYLENPARLRQKRREKTVSSWIIISSLQLFACEKNISRKKKGNFMKQNYIYLLKNGINKYEKLASIG